MMFPSDDPELRGVSSIKLLREAYAQVRECGWKLGNADVVLIGNEPRLELSLRKPMETLLASTLDGDGPVTVRATTTDGLGFAGRGEGLAAQAVALLERVA
jgi:2-C-methyl-D-erythritol 2,4-cyclodiphosphate synthase